MTSDIIYSLITAFLFGLGYFIFRYYSEDALQKAQSIGQSVFMGTCVTNKTHILTIEILDSPELFDDFNNIANSKWTYFSFLKSWTDEKDEILRIFKNNERKMALHSLADSSIKLFWPLVFLIIFYPIAIPGFIVGYYALSLMYFFREIYMFYIDKHSQFIMTYRMAISVIDHSNGKLIELTTHPYLTTVFWLNWLKAWWEIILKLNAKPEVK